jgi:hypothetical protein
MRISTRFFSSKLRVMVNSGNWMKNLLLVLLVLMLGFLVKEGMRV